MRSRTVCDGVDFCPVVKRQQYPSKPIRLIVPLAPGGPSDLLARTMAQQLTPALGQSIIVDNRTGAGGTIGIDAAAKSPGDGYTMLLVAAATYTITANLYPKLPYDARRDLTPVSILAGGPYMLTVHPSLPAKTLKDLIALDKARPQDLNYGSGGTGTGPQMSMELLKLKTGMKITHIPYKGSGPMLIDHIAGHVQVSLSNMIVTLPIVESKRLRGLVVSGATAFEKGAGHADPRRIRHRGFRRCQRPHDHGAVGHAEGHHRAVAPRTGQGIAGARSGGAS